MPHHTPLITTIVASLGLAFVFGAVATRLKMPPLIGYLVAGVVIGPFTPGFVADQALALELAEIGVILLMFGVGLHFSLDDLLSVKWIAIPGALVQIALATLLGMLLAWSLDWPLGQGFVFGLALSVASTVVLLRALEDRRLVETERGRIAVGWLIVEDLAMVLALVVLPATAGLLGGNAADAGEAASAAGAAGAAAAGAAGAAAAAGDGAASAAADTGSIATVVGMTLLRVAAFVALMLIVGRRLIPWMLHAVVHTGSRELFSLAVLAVALGVAFGSAALFGVSFALGAFFAGMVMGESTLTQRAAEETLPLRDAFAVLFFVSVGMLFDPGVLLREPLPVLGVFAIIVVGKSLAALAIVLAFRHPMRTALMIAVSLAQIGEFSFILAGLGIDLGLLTKEGRDLILAGSILSILVNPLLFAVLDRMEARDAAHRVQAEGAAAAAAREPLVPTTLSGHAVVVGYGRVGKALVEDLRAAGVPTLVVEDRDEQVFALRDQGVQVVFDNAVEMAVLQACGLERALGLFVAIPNGYVAARIVEHARAHWPSLPIAARAHDQDRVEDIARHGATLVIMGEREIARRMLQFARDQQTLPHPAG